MRRKVHFPPTFYLLSKYFVINAMEQDLYGTGAGGRVNITAGRSVAITGALSDRNRAVQVGGWPSAGLAGLCGINLCQIWRS